MSALIISAFFFYLLLGIPIAFCLGITSLTSFLAMKEPALLLLLSQRLYAGINSFPLLAIPFFILAGKIMTHGGITQSLINLANALVGHLRGGLAHVNIVVSILFAGLCGSAVADTSAIGSILIPAMEKEGYDRGFSAAVTGASSVIGPIIPPSIIMVVYAYVMGVSVAGLFAAGILPGIVMGIFLMIISYYISKKKNYPKRDRMACLNEIFKALVTATPALITPIIILGGILGGFATPTEAASVAVAYSIIIAIFVLKAIKIKDLRNIFISASVDSAIVLFIIGFATVFSWLVTANQMPQNLSKLILSITENKFLMIILLNLLLFLFGMFLDAGPVIIILAPILAPIAVKTIGLHPLHFGIMMCINVTVGLITPPVGMILYVACGLTGLTIEKLTKSILPFLLAEILLVFIVSFIPEFSMIIPKLLGYY